MQCVAVPPALAADVRAALAAWLPGVEVASEAPRGAAGAAGPASAIAAATDCVIAGPEPTGRAALQLLREARASGYDNAVVLLAAAGAPGGGAAWSADEAAEAAQLGAVLLAADALTGEALASAVVAGVEGTSARDDELAGIVREDDGGLRGELRRTRQQLAAGAMAQRLPHALNNPLAALLAEAQLLELEELAPEHRAAVRRIVELCRRVAGVVREAGTVRPPGGGVA